MSRVKAAKPNVRKTPSTPSVSKDGYEFDASADQWRLNKDVLISLGIATSLASEALQGFRSTLKRYAEEMSAMHTYNMAERLKRFMRDTGASQVSVANLINWRARLGRDEQWQLGGLKGFLLAWHDYGFEGVPEEVVGLLEGWRIQGNEKGAAVAGGCPETGPLTDVEMAALLDWANLAIVRKDIAFGDYAYLLTLVMTARRPVQIAALRGRDLVKENGQGPTLHRLNIPRAKQRGVRFRGAFRSLAILEDLFLVLQQQHRQSIALAEEAAGVQLTPALADEVPIFINQANLKDIHGVVELEEALMGRAPDLLHVTTAALTESLRHCARASTARSERTGEFIRLTATRFRHTRGTKLRREGFGAFIIAALLKSEWVMRRGG